MLWDCLGTFDLVAKKDPSFEARDGNVSEWKEEYNSINDRKRKPTSDTEGEDEEEEDFGGSD